MDLFNQLDVINKSIKQSYCNHDDLRQLDDLIFKDLSIENINNLNNPVKCFDCNKIIDCPHDDLDYDKNDVHCRICGISMSEEIDYLSNPY